MLQLNSSQCMFKRKVYYMDYVNIFECSLTGIFFAKYVYFHKTLMSLKSAMRVTQIL
jgi:hypothetical protein